MNPYDLGWNPWFSDQLNPEDDQYIVARVSRQDMSGYTVLCEQGEKKASLKASLSRNMSKKTIKASELPTVGDWVVCDPASADASNEFNIIKILKRRTKFSRKQSGDKRHEQLLAANVDVLFIVTALDQDFSPRRILRYLVLVQNTGIMPVLVFNKCDLIESQAPYLAHLQRLAIREPCLFVSASHGKGLEGIRAFFDRGVTLAFTGSSGVGKSTLINQLLGEARFETKQVRDNDSRGRHTTTFRELVPGPEGTLILDMPGIREVPIWGEQDKLDACFEDIVDLAYSCRFNDCEHQSEPGCAVQNAISEGAINPERLAIFRQLSEEILELNKQKG